MTLLDFIALALFAWYASYVLIKTSGPFDVFTRVRKITTMGGLLACQYCLIVWMALLGYVILVSPVAPIAYVSAAAGAGMLAHRWTGGDHV